MPAVVPILVGAAAVAGVVSMNQQAKAARAQANATQQAANQQQQQYDEQLAAANEASKIERTRSDTGAKVKLGEYSKDKQGGAPAAVSKAARSAARKGATGNAGSGGLMKTLSKQFKATSKLGLG